MLGWLLMGACETLGKVERACDMLGVSAACEELDRVGLMMAHLRARLVTWRIGTCEVPDRVGACGMLSVTTACKVLGTMLGSLTGSEQTLPLISTNVELEQEPLLDKWSVLTLD